MKVKNKLALNNAYLKIKNYKDDHSHCALYLPTYSPSYSDAMVFNNDSFI